MSKNPGVAAPADRPVVLSRRVDFTAVAALFRMSVARLVRGRRLVVLTLLFSLPIVFALLAQRYDAQYSARQTELALIFILVPQTLIPLTALVFASGMIQDELEEQTLTYLLIRPLPRPAIYAVKLAATLFVTASLTLIFIWITFLVVYEFESTVPADTFLWRPLKTGVSMCLSLAAYGSLFGLMSLFTRRTLVLGVVYIVLFEGILANIDFVIRKLTILYQFRILTIRWLGLRTDDWNITMAESPSLLWAALNLAIAAAIFTVAAAAVFTVREFRVKTPEAT